MTCMASVVTRNQTEVSASSCRLLLLLACAGNAERLQPLSAQSHTHTHVTYYDDDDDDDDDDDYYYYYYYYFFPSGSL